MADEAPIRVLLVDDHAVVRRGMRAYLAMLDGIEVVGEAADGRQAVDRVRQLAADHQRPDVILMDIIMPKMDGIAATAAVRKRWPEIKVVVLTSFVQEDKIEAAVQAGATGYLLKDAQADDIALAIRAACGK
jgi:DNA-binding NarL/FixJ family response regulator